MKVVDILVYTPRVLLPRPDVVDIPDWPSMGDLERVFMPLIGGFVEHIEHVSVLFRDRAADMFVDELGAVDLPSRPRLAVNEAATLIYHENSRRRGDDLRGAPRIHGVAVLCVSARVWR